MDEGYEEGAEFLTFQLFVYSEVNTVCNAYLQLMRWWQCFFSSSGRESDHLEEGQGDLNKSYLYNFPNLIRIDKGFPSSSPRPEVTIWRLK